MKPLLLLFLLALGGCAGHLTKPGVSTSEAKQDWAECRYSVDMAKSVEDVSRIPLTLRCMEMKGYRRT